VETKSVYRSKALWGAILAGLSALAAGGFGVEISPEENEKIVHTIAGVGQAVGIAVAIYGRFTARTRLRF